MTKRNDGGMAFPAQPIFMPDGAGIAHIQDGMSLLDYFAGQTLVGDWAAYVHGVRTTITTEELESRARLYYRMAQAMIAVRDDT